MVMSKARPHHAGRLHSKYLFNATLAAAPLLLLGIAAEAQAQTWTTLTRSAPASVDEMNLLTDGTVMVHHADFSTSDGIWYKLTPDSNGNYANGTWTQAASLPSGYGPIDFNSAVLPDGKLIVEGGEYNFGTDVETNLGAIYDPVANKWTAVSAPAGWTLIGDGPSAVLANGTFMLGQSGSATKAQAFFNESSLTWTLTGSNKFDANAEEGWVLLPNGKVLTVDAYFGQYNATGTNSEIFDPATGSWSFAGSTLGQLWDSAAACGGSANASYEVGPMALRPDGTVFATGSNQCAAGHTSIYHPNTGTWTQGPDFPNSMSAFDAPAAVETNGNVIVEVSPGDFGNGAEFFEWNGTSLSRLPDPVDMSQESSFPGKMMNLPNGQILYTHYASDVHVFTPGGSYQSSWQPTVSSVATQLAPGSTYAIMGTQFNGLTQGAWYGDDAAMATNYPLVRLVNSATGHVFYCRTHGHSTMAVATGNASVSTNFDVPANVETGASQLYVVANGIPSNPVSVNVGSSSGTTATLNPTGLTFAGTNVGSASAAQNVALKNNGPGALTVSTISVSGDYAQTNNCATLASGASCTISVTFKPTATGTRSGTLTVTDNATNSPQTASLSGTGTSSGGGVLTNGVGVAISDATINHQQNWSMVVPAGATNLVFSLAGGTGDADLYVKFGSAPTLTSYDCRPYIAGNNETCTIANVQPGTYYVMVNAYAAYSGVTLKGSYSAGSGTTASLSTSSLSFGSTTVGSTSAAQNVTLSNTGSSTLSISSVVVSGDFAQTNNCGTSLASGASCAIALTFKPTASGTRTGTLTVTDNASNGPQTASLSGTGAASGGNINFSGTIATQGSYIFTPNFVSGAGTVTATLSVPAGTGWRFVADDATVNQSITEADGAGPLTITFTAVAGHSYNFFVQATTGSGAWSIAGSHP